MTTRDPVDEVNDDLLLLLQACSAALGDRVLSEVRRAAGEAVRFNDGYVFQHLIPGATAVTALASKLGVTQQAASKQVADLEARGLVVRRADPEDGRSRLVELSPRGWKAVEAGRAARREIHDELVEMLGARQAKATMVALRKISDHTGAADRMRSRRLRAEADR